MLCKSSYPGHKTMGWGFDLGIYNPLSYFGFVSGMVTNNDNKKGSWACTSSLGNNTFDIVGFFNAGALQEILLDLSCFQTLKNTSLFRM
jgi:hypothetical protein